MLDEMAAAMVDKMEQGPINEREISQQKPGRFKGYETLRCVFEKAPLRRRH